MIVGISGKKGSGKTTLGMFLVEHFEGAREINFADALKQSCERFYGANWLQMRGTEADKNTLVRPSGCTARELMQRLGASMRAIWPDCFVYAWSETVLATWKTTGLRPIVVCDVRFRNEVAKIHEMGGIVIRLKRSVYPDDHESEIDLDRIDGTTKHEGNGVYFDAVIDGNASVDGMKSEALRVIREAGIL